MKKFTLWIAGILGSAGALIGEKRMKKIIALMLIFAMALSLMVGCQAKEEPIITCEQVIAAYEEAGYVVWHKEYPEQEHGYQCVVQISLEDGPYIEFHFHETPEAAKEESAQRQRNGLLWFFSVIYNQPTWLQTEVYQNIAIEYDDRKLYKPFEELIK